MNDLVSIIMLSKDNGRYVEETVRSVLAQTCQNWELLFVAKSNDEALKIVSELRDEDIRNQRISTSNYTSGSRIKVSYIVGQEEVTPRRNSALKEAKGKWIAFLDAGDVWEPTKLEKQVAFMKDHGYVFSYTKYALINKDSEDRGFVIGGKEKISYQDMMKCCWPAYLTVMYDAEKIGKLYLKNLRDNNDYALWLKASEEGDCYLLDECLAKLRTPWSVLGKFLLTNNIKWRYEVYRKELGIKPIMAHLMTMRNMWYGMLKRFKYVEKIS